MVSILFGVPYIPFLPTLQARTSELEKQLDALDAEAFPRDLQDIRPNEVCIDWAAEGPRETLVPTLVPMKAATVQNLLCLTFATKTPDFVSMARWIANAKALTMRKIMTELKASTVQINVPFVGLIRL
mmetsp:Transcript_28473/g.51598  ORF Transcript_28473/g.51598 Transcript_28473/m.51598 type:complete len:128 (+) Transcript_28473:320-703(+)